MAIRTARPPGGIGRGFTLVEVLVAGALSLLAVVAATATIAWVQRANGVQQRAAAASGRARLALELLGADIRSAGDSVDLLPAHCLGAAATPGAPSGCPAILEPHPWRITIARNSWGPGPDGIERTADDTPPILPFDANGANVVTWQFVPDGPRRSFGEGHGGWIGRLERILDPWGFEDGPHATVVLENVILDDRMRVDPADPSRRDERYDEALFLYLVASSGEGEYVGDDFAVRRTTRTGSFLLPPVRFFAIPDPAHWPEPSLPHPPWLPAWPQEVVGWRASGAAPQRQGPLRALGSGFEADLRHLLDFNRIRAVRVAFKLADEEDPRHLGGIDLDPQRPGTARILAFESTFELKAFAGTPP